jgi:hypothetical protein
MKKTPVIMTLLLTLALLGCSLGAGQPSTSAPPDQTDPSVPDINGTWSGQFTDLAGGVERVATLTLVEDRGVLSGSIAFNLLDASMPEFYAITGSYDGARLQFGEDQGRTFWGSLNDGMWTLYAAWGCYDCADQAWALMTLSRGVALPAVTTDEPVGTMLVQPGDPTTIDSWMVDFDTRPTAASATIPGGDSYARDLFERPFDADMTYFPDTDILWAFLSSTPDWVYVSMQIADVDPNSGNYQSTYGVEFDLDLDGRGDTFVWATQPFTTGWTNTNVQIFTDQDNDVGGPTPLTSDAPWAGSGYETLEFDRGSGKDPGGAWVRISPQDPTFIQIAFHPTYINFAGAYLWNVWADRGPLSPGSFDYNDWITLAQAGSPLSASPDYPLKGLFLIDNTCRAAYGFVPVGNEPGLCLPADDPNGNQPGQSGGERPGTGIVVLVRPTDTPTPGGPTLTPGDDFPPPPENGQINGQVWQDTNGNSLRDPGEPGWNTDAIALRTDGYGGTCNVTVATTLPDTNGFYRFTDLWPTPYCVVFLTSQPTGACGTQRNVSVPSGGSATADFCVVPAAPPPGPVSGSIQGLVFYDNNANGGFDTSDTRADTYSFSLFHNSSCSGAAFANYVTDPEGLFTINNLNPETWCIQISTPGGPVLPANPQAVTVTAGSTAVVTFAIQPPP